MEDIVYKYVSEKDGKFFSMDTPPIWTVEYKVGEWTEPVLKGSKLFVFKELADLLDYFPAIVEQSGIYVWRAEAKDIEKASGHGEPFEEESIKTFWECKNLYGANDRWRGRGIPDFYFASEVMLIEQISKQTLKSFL